MCLRFQFCTHQRVCILYFLKKSPNCCTLLFSRERLSIPAAATAAAWSMTIDRPCVDKYTVYTCIYSV